jgi:hypothetical protein
MGRSLGKVHTYWSFRAKFGLSNDNLISKRGDTYPAVQPDGQGSGVGIGTRSEKPEPDKHERLTGSE